MISYYYIHPDSQNVRKCSPGAPEFDHESIPRLIKFDGTPISQQRPRTRVVGTNKHGKPTGGKIYAQIYNPTSTKKVNLLKLIVKRPIFEQPTFLYALACYEPPASWSNTKTERSYGTHKVTKPDGTNILKFYEDLLEGLFMPKDQYCNPTMIERMYAKSDFLVICACPVDHVTFNIPKVVKKAFLGELLK